MSTFDGFPRQAMTFFRQLQRNNDRDWLNAHKAEFEAQVKAPMLALVDQVNARLTRFAADHVSEPKKAIYRIHRDTRFSKDKTPYKLHLGAMFGHRLLPKNYCAGYYFHVSHTECAVGCGLYMPEPEQLKAVRDAIVADVKRFERLVSDKRLVRLMGPLQGDKLARVPQGYDAGAPAAEYVRMKQLYYYTELPAAAALERKFVDEVAKRFEACAGLVAHLNDVILRTLHADEPDAPKRPAPMF